MKVHLSISKDAEAYDYATFNGKRSINLSAGARSLTLKPGDVFGYRDGKTAVYVVTPERGLTYEYKVSEDDFDKRLAPKSDEVKLARAKKLFAQAEAAPARPARTGMRTSVKPKPEPTPRIAPEVKTKGGTQVEEETHLLKLVGDPRQFAAIKTRGDALAYITRVWHAVNKLRCDNMMTIPHFRLMKDVGKGFRLRGQWRPHMRLMNFAPRLFQAKEEIALTTIVHEIAHQAVSELDQVVDRTQGGHGPNWCSWMRKFGLTPARYSQFDNVEYMSEAERAEHTRKQTLKEEATKAQVMPKMAPVPLKAAQWFDPTGNKWIKGVIIDKNDLAGKRWAFTNHESSNAYAIVPASWFHAVTTDDKANLLAAYLANATRIRQALTNNREVKRHLRNARRSIIGW